MIIQNIYMPNIAGKRRLEKIINFTILDKPIEEEQMHMSFMEQLHV